MIFFISDTHFGHANIIRFCNRPWPSVKAMNEALIQNWNMVVRPNDTVYHLGDICFKGGNEVLPQLNGHIHLIIGNHDSRQVQKHPRILSAKLMNIIKVSGQKITLCHYAMRVWPGSRKGAWHLYGHSHNTLPSIGKSMDVGVDATQLWRPVSFDEVETFMRHKPDNVDAGLHHSVP